MKLDARYTVKTSDDRYIYIRAHGQYRPGPRTDYAKQVEQNREIPKQRSHKTMWSFSRICVLKLDRVPTTG